MRGKIIEISSHQYRYDYYDIYEEDSHYEYLNVKGYQGGGPTWEGIIYGALKLHGPKILEQISFDSEGEGLAIWSSSKQALETIANLVAELKKDNELLNKAIMKADQDDQIE